MTEDWAVRDLTEDETKEVSSELANASEEEPVPDTKQTWDGDTRDLRSASERFMEDSESESEEEKEVEATSGEGEAEKEVEKPADGDEADAPAQKGVEWMEALPDEAKKHFKGLQHEISKQRDRNKSDREEYERRFDESAKSIKDQIAQAIKDAQPKPEAPDKEIYPEEYAQFMEDEAKVTKDELERVQADSKVVRDGNNLFMWMGKQEVDDPDFLPAFEYLKGSIIQEEINKGHSQAKAEETFQGVATQYGSQLREEGGSWTQAVKYYANQYGYKQNEGGSEAVKETTEETPKGSGEDIAKAVTDGMKAAKSLGATSGAKAGDLTSKDIASIEDPEEHTAAFEKWEKEQIGGNANWK